MSPATSGRMRRTAKSSPTPIPTVSSIPHWLTLMVRAMAENGFDGCGGPNYAPHEAGWVEGCVAASPGAPCHVLVGDDRAEHLAGCNMIFRKAALLELGGFDPQFTAAGDNVDICWRMLDAGFTLGFCPSAFVWHFRRNTVKAYYGQQRGYGKAEAMLFPKYPERFNALGQIRWRGTIPGIARTYPGGALNRVGWTHRTDELQAVADAPLSVAKVLPLTAEWNAGCVVALALSLGSGITILPALAMLALGPIWALYYAWQAPLEKCHDSLGSRLFVAFLAWSGPMVRTWTRWKTRMRTISLGSEMQHLSSAPHYDGSAAASISPTGTRPGRRARACSGVWRGASHAPVSRSRPIPDGTTTTSKFDPTRGRACTSRPPTRSTRERG